MRNCERRWRMDKLLSFLGIVAKSGNLVVGYNKCEEGAKTGLIRVVLLATEASQNTKDKFVGYSERYDVTVLQGLTSEQLSGCVGRNGIMVMGVKNKSMARNVLAIHEGIQEETKSNGGGSIVKDQSI